jgi:hypothetical protein
MVVHGTQAQNGKIIVKGYKTSFIAFKPDITGILLQTIQSQICFCPPLPS